jgi:hypothetical protein
VFHSFSPTICYGVTQDVDASLELHADQPEKPRHFEVKLLGPGMVLKKKRVWKLGMYSTKVRMGIWRCNEIYNEQNDNLGLHENGIYPNRFFLGFLRENDDH